MELFLISALVTIATATPVPGGNREPNGHSNANLYKGFNGQPKADYGENLRWVQEDIHEGRTCPNAEGYQCFHGDVSSYPIIDEWLSFDTLWDINEEAILSNNNSNADIQRYVRQSILQVADDSNVSPRLILAAVMQESSGKASVHCTGHMLHCGLMQASFNSHSFDPWNAEASILQMIREGVQVSFWWFELGSRPAAGQPYTAARSYNSGSVATDGNLYEAKWGTASYANDIANRLIGWDGIGKGFRACYDD
ncbi:hypothetical protein WHR41_03190 [Cladosporium halotolerans]|uniref:Transglycosylase SLT domain-containing protein n=1 Tax=Cladosporium halotolerans TaxID=1052096 RepID=A0AB34KSJ7_9PEZI